MKTEDMFSLKGKNEEWAIKLPNNLEAPLYLNMYSSNSILWRTENRQYYTAAPAGFAATFIIYAFQSTC